ncbi:MAG: Putative ATP-dependent carboligase [Methanomicrobiales archaeon 53_19]|uniref:ATP-grasp domain-containing protein n=1 Tax=Methanocalculus sp. TaxID=2004547 RepID=UPI00074816B9|nr:ATP-grasp domain-containing protein [Methanocalculus sp.]KUL03250.1 MAG: Putative ATP-dependent carboligase [Methanomicrobiales archaeon 53_19]HIJ07255.1 ATP-grasp domain-containing protein [Methanocalculus sp.]
MTETILVAGYATRHVARSARRGGYRVCAVDHFCDLDLGWIVSDYEGFLELTELPAAIDRIRSRNSITRLILTSGAEMTCCPEIPRAGTDVETIRTFLDKSATQEFFSRLAVPHPGIAEEGRYPVMIKPVNGAGGWRNAIVRTDDEKEAWIADFDLPYICQQFVEGMPASVSCVSDGRRAVAIAANEQILRGSGDSAFGFAGSITPCDHPLAGEMMALAEEIVSASGCVGSVGVDFVLSDDAVAIEVNPRFQATLDTVEGSTGANLFSLHMDACSGRLPRRRPQSIRYSARRILFAEKDFMVRSRLNRFAAIAADIPHPGTEFTEGDAMISVFGYGSSRDDALRMLDNHISLIRQYLE